MQFTCALNGLARVSRGRYERRLGLSNSCLVPLKTLLAAPAPLSRSSARLMLVETRLRYALWRSRLPHPLGGRSTLLGRRSCGLRTPRIARRASRSRCALRLLGARGAVAISASAALRAPFQFPRTIDEGSDPKANRPLQPGLTLPPPPFGAFLLVHLPLPIHEEPHFVAFFNPARVTLTSLRTAALEGRELAAAKA